MAWDFPRFRWWEYAGAVSVTATNVLVEQFGGDFRNSSWNGGVLLDDATREIFAAETAEGRHRAADISDVLWPVVQYFPVVDSLVTPVLTDNCNFDVAWQMTMINWQALGITAMLIRALQYAAGRARPSLQECADDPTYDGYCSGEVTGATASFISGHTAMAFASASLTCVHHQALPMYGGNAADAIVCGLTVAAASATGALRLVADKHWQSDVLVGAAIGVGAGYALPKLLHYGSWATASSDAGDLPHHLGLLPMASGSSAGAMAVGSF